MGPDKGYIRVTHPLSKHHGMVGQVIARDPALVIVRFGDPDYFIFRIGSFQNLPESTDGVIRRIPLARLTERRSVNSIQQIIERFARMGLAFDIIEDDQVVWVRRMQTPVTI